MKNRLRHTRVSSFTLVELLIVIAIIGVLAAILIPTLAGVRKRARIVTAKSEITQLVTDITKYYNSYSRPPSSKAAKDSLNTSCPDFTFGTVNTNGTLLTDRAGTPLWKIQSTGNVPGYQTPNSELMAILMDIEHFGNGVATANLNHVRNPKRIVFSHAQTTSDPTLPGVGPDGVYRDPWGNPYIVTLDFNEDNQCQDGYYYPLTKGPNPLLVRGTVMVWSLGPDGMVHTNRPAHYKEGRNKDNILSWE